MHPKSNFLYDQDSRWKVMFFQQYFTCNDYVGMINMYIDEHNNENFVR